MPTATLDTGGGPPAATEADLRSLATRVGVLTGILVALGLATLAALSTGVGPLTTLLVLSAIAVINLALPLLAAGIRLARIDSEWRALGVAGMIVGVVATMAIGLGVIAVVLFMAGCHDGRCAFV